MPPPTPPPQAAGSAEPPVRWLRLPIDDVSLTAEILDSSAFVIEPIDDDQTYALLFHRHVRSKIVVSVSTKTAFRCALSQAVASALAQRLAPRQVALSDVEVATQEAIGNAVLHGNLRLSTLSSSNHEALEARIREIEDRLQNPIMAHRRVTVACDWDEAALSVEICDEGEGIPDLLEAGVAVAGGRGLSMMRRLAAAVVFDNERKCVRMTFPISPTATNPGL